MIRMLHVLFFRTKPTTWEEPQISLSLGLSCGLTFVNVLSWKSICSHWSMLEVVNFRLIRYSACHRPCKWACCLWKKAVLGSLAIFFPPHERGDVIQGGLLSTLIEPKPEVQPSSSRDALPMRARGMAYYWKIWISFPAFRDRIEPGAADAQVFQLSSGEIALLST